ncbi:MAG TPA: hypothetical protein ENJ35_00170 [Gammaproteobacteria bacterium]|nr:hypothetical protein [Gammaproteobacteria bacterium]
MYFGTPFDDAGKHPNSVGITTPAPATTRRVGVEAGDKYLWDADVGFAAWQYKWIALLAEPRQRSNP